MIARCVSLVFVFALCLGPAPAAAQESSDAICAAARSYLARNPKPILAYMILAKENLGKGDWKQTPDTAFSASRLLGKPNVRQIYLAYFRPAALTPPGAVSVRIAVNVSDTDKATNNVELHRPAIGRGLNRCEPRGRYPVNRLVRLNEYIDYHSLGGVSSGLEDFHFSYPTSATDCAQTDEARARQYFAFEGVGRTQGDTLVARWFRFAGPAYAVNHQYLKLRSELHFRPAAELRAMCVGFGVGLNGVKPTSIVIHDHGFGKWMPERLSLEVTR